MKKIIMIIFLVRGLILAQEIDKANIPKDEIKRSVISPNAIEDNLFNKSELAKTDSIIIADLQRRANDMILYQQQLEREYPIIKEYLGAEYIKNYLLNSIKAKKKNGNGK